MISRDRVVEIRDALWKEVWINVDLQSVPLDQDSKAHVIQQAPETLKELASRIGITQPRLTRTFSPALADWGGSLSNLLLAVDLTLSYALLGSGLTARDCAEKMGSSGFVVGSLSRRGARGPAPRSESRSPS